MVDSAGISTSTLCKLWFPIIESEKPLLQDIYNFNWKDGKSNPARHVEQTHWEFCKYLATLETSTHLERWDTTELTTMTKGRVTEFHHKRWILSSSLMDQELIHNPNVTPSSDPTIFWGFVWQSISHIAHITYNKNL